MWNWKQIRSGNDFVKYVVLFLCLLCGAERVPAQPLLRALPDYECVHYDRNRLHFPAGKENMSLFYAHLDSLLLFGKGCINILHIGGSHIQADFLPHAIRTDLVSLQPGLVAERGIIFPHNVLPHMNTSRNYAIRCSGEWTANRNSRKPWDLRMGLAGMAAMTSDTAAEVRFCLNKSADAPQWRFDRLRVLGYASSDSVVPILLAVGDTLLPELDTVQPGYVFRLPAMTDSACIRFRIPADGQWFTLTGILPENDLQGINYFSVGVNGAAVPAWLRCVDFERDLHLVKPQLVVFGIGINDAAVPYGDFNPEKFKQNYRLLIERIRRVSPDCALIFTTNNDSYRSAGRRTMVPNRNGELVQRAFYELAEEYQGAVWDLFDFMGGYGSVEKWEMYDLIQRDRLHFTQKGYELIGHMFYNALISDYLGYY